MRAQLLLASTAAVLLLLGFASQEKRAGRVLDAQLHHLGNDATPDWKDAPKDPEGTRLDVRFESAANAGDWTLYLRQLSVDNTWRLKANGVEIALLRTGQGDKLVERFYAVPAKCLVDGANVLSFEPDVPTDDVVLGDVRLVEKSLREIFDLAKLSVRVRDAKSGAALPARVTFVAVDGTLPPLFFAESNATAARDGVLYTTGDATLELPRGTYTSYATRGCEWSLSTLTVTLLGDVQPKVEHALTREVDTAGFIAADTHIHTLQFSGHGDSSALERQVTLAGEGVELAISTDHNHNTDYAPFQKQAGVTPYFTAVVGNEVTTEVGHFNGFPLRASDPLPPHEFKDYGDYPKIVEGIRAKGAKVVILNHPRWPTHDDSPFGTNALDQLTGRFARELKLTMDATEMINATTEENEPMLLFRDWFALLNEGTRIFAVGSSDSHTVADPVGQGRTYVASASDDPTKIDVDAACAAIANGHTSISMGIFATVTVNERWTMGDVAELANDVPSEFRVALRVRAPSWVQPRKATLFIDGVAWDERRIDARPGLPTDAELKFDVRDYPQRRLMHLSSHMPAPADVWLVCVIEGDGIAAPYWKTLNPYTLAATNPVFLDFNGDGWTSPRGTAKARMEDVSDVESLDLALDGLDDTTSVLLLDEFARDRQASGVTREELAKALHAAADARAKTAPRIAEFLARW